MYLGLRRLIVICVLLAGAGRASAIGWDSDDFLIGGGPSATTRIGVFDHDLTFKGFLDSNFITVAGMDFDAAGHLVAVASGNLREVRVYESSGAHIGGFIRTDNLLGVAADLKVTPSGSYVVATQNFGGGDGAREFATDGSYLRQYGSGDITGVAVVPGNRLWIGGIGSSTISIFDLASGLKIGSFSVAGMSSSFSMSYSNGTHTTLSVSQARVWELDQSGSLLRTFTASGILGLSSATRGPNGDVFATDGSQRVLHWNPDGEFVGAVSTSETLGGAGAIVWAGNIPEPSLSTMSIIGAFAISGRQVTRRVRQG